MSTPFFYEFNGVKFGPKFTDLVPSVSPPIPVSGQRHVPYSNIDIIDFAGFSPRKFTASIRVHYLNADQFEQMLYQTHTLIIAGRTWDGATLTKLDNHQITPLPVAGIDHFEGMWHFYDAEWTIGGVPS